MAISKYSNRENNQLVVLHVCHKPRFTYLFYEYKYQHREKEDKHYGAEHEVLQQDREVAMAVFVRSFVHCSLIRALFAHPCIARSFVHCSLIRALFAHSCIARSSVHCSLIRAFLVHSCVVRSFVQWLKFPPQLIYSIANQVRFF